MRAGLLTESGSELGSQPAHLLPVVIQRAPARATRVSTAPSTSVIEIVIADAVVRVGAGTDAALLALVLHSLRS